MDTSWQQPETDYPMPFACQPEHARQAMGDEEPAAPFCSGSAKGDALALCSDGETAVLGTIPSDAHSWSLVFLHLFLEEMGFRVINLGVCTPTDLFAETVSRESPALVVVSTTNGHGHLEGPLLIERLKRMQVPSKAVIGGKLSTNVELEAHYATTLIEAGYSGVFCGPSAIPKFQAFLGFESAKTTDEHVETDAAVHR